MASSVLPVSGQSLHVAWEGALGREGTGPGEFLQPVSIAMDPAGHLYVADTGNHRIQKFDRDGQFIAQAGGFGFQTRQLNRPMAVAATGLDVYVADTQNRRVMRLDRQLNVLGQVAGEDQAHRFGFIRGLAASGAGDIYLVDSENEEVVRLNTARRVEARFGGFGQGDGQLSKPAGVAVDREGRVYVADAGHHRIAVYDAFGGYLREIGKGVLSRPEGVDVDDTGRVFIADTGNHRIAIFGPDGTALLTFGAEGKGPGSFRAPCDMAALPDGRVFVADTGNHRICRLRLSEP